MLIIGSAASGGGKPGTPTIGTATSSSSGTATITFTPPTYLGKGGTVTYTATSSPGGITGTSTSSPITVTGLTNGTAYTFTVKATTSYGVSSDNSAASNSVTPAVPFAATGGTITTPGDGYKYHTFTGGGTFAVTSGSQPAAVVLVVAGGGGGGWSPGPQVAGGGGAGGVIYSPVAFSPTGGNGSGSYTVTVGGGGAGSPSGSGTNGSDSSFIGLTTAIGGGRGGGAPNQPGGPGGSGGGAPSVVPSAGAGTPGQGFDAGSPDSPATGNRMGGGGAGGRSTNQISYPTGEVYGISNGGIGVSYFGNTYAGGGGGVSAIARNSALDPYIPVSSIGGSGIGGNGVLYSLRPTPQGTPYVRRGNSAGVANRGGGGGAGSVDTSNGVQYPSLAGGSGVVIVRYPV
jgi:hypothetical protein